MPQSSAVFGFQVALDGDTAVVAAQGETVFGSYAAGAVHVFERDPGGSGAWNHSRHLTASDAAQGDTFGAGLDLHGDVLVVGAPYADGSANARGRA